MNDLKLTPQEENIVKYHRNSIETGNVGDENGDPITVYSTTIYIPEGKYKGQFTTVPGWVDNKIIKDENVLYDRWKTDIEKGKWPIYESGEAGGKRAEEIHSIMDDEVDQARGAMKKEPQVNMPMKRGADRPMLTKERLQ
jgi:uncharacterized protein YcnI